MSPALLSPVVSNIPFSKQRRLKGLASFVVMLQYLSKKRKTLSLTSGEFAGMLVAANEAILWMKNTYSGSAMYPELKVEWFLQQCQCPTEFIKSSLKGKNLETIAGILYDFEQMLPDSEFLTRRLFQSRNLVGKNQRALASMLNEIMRSFPKE